MKAFVALLLMSLSPVVHADTSQQVLELLQAKAGGAASVERGKQLYFAKFSAGKTESCSVCHTADPRETGRHARTHKAIDPLAPSANRERFSGQEMVEKWFRRNCTEVLGRVCTAQEKADFAAFVMAQR
jgi:cytochrome c peroxidase